MTSRSSAPSRASSAMPHRRRAVVARTRWHHALGPPSRTGRLERRRRRLARCVVIVVSGSAGLGAPSIYVRGYGADTGELLLQVDLFPENDVSQLTFNVEPAFQPVGDVAYDSTHFAGDGHLYAIAIANPPPRGLPCDLNSDGIASPADFAKLLANWS